MNEQLKDRLILPVAIPLGALIFILIVTVGFGKLLLSVPVVVATAVAIMAAISVLTFFSVLAVRPRLPSGGFAILMGVASVPFLLGGAVSAGLVDIADEEDHLEPVVFTVNVVAENIAFDPTELEVPAGVDIEIEFENRDADPITHNIQIFDGVDASAPTIFSETPFAGPRTVTYEVGKLDAGSYFFLCVVHANMTGKIVAAEEPPTEDDGSTGGLAISADELAFDTEKLMFSPSTPVSLIFENKEAQSHNVSIYTGSDASGEQVFKGEIFTGPATRTYELPALDAGNYYFQCDVHPFMNGGLEVG